MSKRIIKKSMRVADGIINTMVLICLLILFIYGGYTIWDTNHSYRRAYASAYQSYRPISGEELGFEELQAINDDVFGWITVYGTSIDYPLLQGTDNLRYVDYNARGEPARTGAIFLDFRNNQNFTDFNNIIYGHDMARDAMFGEIGNFLDETYFNDREFGMIYTGQKHYGVQFFAFLAVDAHDTEIYNPTMTNPDVKEAFLARIFNEAIQFRDLDVTIHDRLVMLSTCTPNVTNGRHILIGRLTEEVQGDTFLENHPSGRGVDRLLQSPLGLATGSLVVIVLTAGITLLLASRQKKDKNKPDLKEIEDVLEVKEKAKKTKKEKRPSTLRREFLFIFAKICGILMIVILMFTFVFGVIQVSDASMAPAMREGDLVFFQRMGRDYSATDVIIVRYEDRHQVRRVVAVAGDVVDITEQGLIVNERLQQERHIFEETTQFVEGIRFPLTVPEGEMFILGDSRGRATDSRIYGAVRVEDVLGRVITAIRRRNL